MKTSFLSILAASAIVCLASPLSAAIMIVNQAEGWMGNPRTDITTVENGTIPLQFDSTGADKLVFSVASESGFNNQQITITGATFNGDPLMQAVQNNFAPPGSSPFSNDGGSASIWYLDNPSQVSNGTLTVSYTTTGGGPNGGLASIIGLSGTAPGVGNVADTWTSQTTAGNVSTSITTSGDDSFVLAMVENSGANNGAGIPNVVGSLTLDQNGEWGNQWGSYATGFEFVPLAGTTLTPTFSTNAGGSIHVVAAEFLAAAVAPVPEPASLALWGLIGVGLVAIRRYRRK